MPTLLAFADAGEAAALTGVATVAAASVAAWGARSSRSRAVERIGERLHNVEDECGRLTRRVELMTDAFGRWRTESDATLVRELGAMRADVGRLVEAIERREH
jgi:HAMP domain-containing protein